MSSDHPGDDALSALLDGEATPEEAGHVEGCAACTGRLDELRRAADLIGSPVGPVDHDRREAAVAAALCVRVVPIQRRRRAQPPGWLLGAAAVVVLALGLVPLLSRDGSDDQETSASAGREELAQESADTDEGSDTAAEDSTMAFRAPGPVDAGDLGTVTDHELQDRVTGALLAPLADGGQAAPTTTAPQATSAPSCEAEIRATDTAAGALRLTARATVDGRDARVLAFEVTGAEGAVLRVYVVAGDDCTDVVRTLSFPLP